MFFQINLSGQHQFSWPTDQHLIIISIPRTHPQVDQLEAASRKKNQSLHLGPEIKGLNCFSVLCSLCKPIVKLQIWFWSLIIGKTFLEQCGFEGNHLFPAIADGVLLGEHHLGSPKFWEPLALNKAPVPGLANWFNNLCDLWVKFWMDRGKQSRHPKEMQLF